MPFSGIRTTETTRMQKTRAVDTYEELKVKYENPCCHKFFLGILVLDNVRIGTVAGHKGLVSR